jgi:fumarate reductase subunit D
MLTAVTRVGFWHPSLRHVRLEAMTKWVITTTFLMAFIIGVLSIYWGALFRVEQNMHKLKVFVVDFDGRAAPYNTSDIQPVVGPAIVKLARQLVASSEPNLGYEVMEPDAFGYDPIQVRQAVFDWDAWASIVINPNATAMLQSAVQTGNTSYDPLGACQLTYIDSRDDTNWFDIISPMITAFMTEATSMVGQQWTQQVLQDARNNATILRNAASVPQALSPAIGFSQYNLRPFYPFTAIPAVSIGLIYLIIVSFFSFSFYLPIHFKVRSDLLSSIHHAHTLHSTLNQKATLP